MCAKCVEAVEETFPEVPDDEVGGFLMNVTAFPCAEPEYILKQLRDLRAQTPDYKQCYAIVEAEMRRLSDVDVDGVDAP